MNATDKKYIETAKKFVKSPDFGKGIVSATKAGFDGSGYSVELFNDGTWRVLWDNSIGNLYMHPTSMIVSLPQLSDEDLNDSPDWEDNVDTGYFEDEFMSDVREGLS